MKRGAAEKMRRPARRAWSKKICTRSSPWYPRKKEVRKRRCRFHDSLGKSTVRCCWVLLVSDVINRIYFLFGNLNLDSGKYPFGGLAATLTNSNFQIQTMHGGCLKPTTATKAQRQEDVYPHVVMNVLPFQRAWGKAKNCQSPWLSERYGFLSVLWWTYGSTVCPSPPIRPLPLLPFLRRSWLLSLRPLPNGNGSFLVVKSDSFFSVRVVTACRSWQSDLACLLPVSRSTDLIVHSCTHDLVGFLGSYW